MPRSHPLLVFDGDCGFCTWSVGWLERRFRREVEVAPWQRLDLAELGLERRDVDRYAWWLDESPASGGGPHRERGHRAVGRALRACGGLWPWLGTVLLLPAPFSWLWAAGYRLVARLRGWLPGATPACKLPPEKRS